MAKSTKLKDQHRAFARHAAATINISHVKTASESQTIFGSLYSDGTSSGASTAAQRRAAKSSQLIMSALLKTVEPSHKKKTS